MTETDLAKQFLEYFSDEDVYQEVPGSGIIDIVVKRGSILVAVEVKVNLNFEVIEQAVKNKQLAHYSYIAVPAKKYFNNSIQDRICKQLGIGVLFYSKYSITYGRNKPNLHVQEVTRPALNRKIRKLKLEPWMKRSVAGSQNDRMTAFKYLVEQIESALMEAKEGLTVPELFKKLPKHYSTMSSFKSCVVGYCRSGVITCARFEDGKFYYQPKNTN